MKEHPNKKRWAPTMYQVVYRRFPRNAGSRPSSRPTRADRNWAPPAGLNIEERVLVNSPKRNIAAILTDLMRTDRMTGCCSLPAMRSILKEGF